jgi:hypothetical protein
VHVLTQVRHLVDCGLIPPFLHMLKFKDPKVPLFVLEGLYAILCVGALDNDSDNPYLAIFEESEGFLYFVFVMVVACSICSKSKFMQLITVMCVLRRPAFGCSDFEPKCRHHEEGFQDFG